MEDVTFYFSSTCIAWWKRNAFFWNFFLILQYKCVHKDRMDQSLWHNMGYYLLCV